LLDDTFVQVEKYRVLIAAEFAAVAALSDELFKE